MPVLDKLMYVSFQKRMFKTCLKNYPIYYQTYSGKNIMYWTVINQKDIVNNFTATKHFYLEFMCDKCGVHFITYQRYNELRETCLCKKCKQEQNSLKLYGTKHRLQSKDFLEKRNKTMLEKYGTKNYTQTKEFLEKFTTTNLKKFGVKYPAQNKEIKQKQMKSLYKNNVAPTSKQQKYICDLFNAKLNVLYQSIFIDMVVDDIAIEYDGGGHKLQVKLGKLSEQEFIKKETERENIIFKHYKLFRIVSVKDKLYEDKKMLYCFEIAKQLLKYTNKVVLNIEENTFIYNNMVVNV